MSRQLESRHSTARERLQVPSSRQGASTRGVPDLRGRQRLTTRPWEGNARVGWLSLIWSGPEIPGKNLMIFVIEHKIRNAGLNRDENMASQEAGRAAFGGWSQRTASRSTRSHPT